MAASTVPEPRTSFMYSTPISRRQFIVVGAAATAALATGCALNTVTDSGSADRLNARPGRPTRTASVGLQPLGLESSGRDGLLYVPASALTAASSPLLVLLHGAGGSASNWFGSYGTRAEASGIVMLAVDSRTRTWRTSLSGAGADGQFIDRALASTFDRVAIDPQRIALAGFSDGASFALTIGLRNGDLFHKVATFSPGYFEPGTPHGKPLIFMSHGVNDTVLPIDQTSRQFASLLIKAGYSVEYHEFFGGHEVPPEMSDALITWLGADWP